VGKHDDYGLPSLFADDLGDQSWRDQAACKGSNVDEWFPGRGEPTAAQKAICGGCPVREACLEYALAAHQRTGIWGGLSERERRLLKRQLRQAAAEGDAQRSA
jgi:WhiB family redox-sensing transcriptional regulator